MAAGYNAQGQYVDHQGNPAPDPRTGDMAPAMSQAISNLFGTSYTPGRAWDPSMGPEEEFNPNVPHDLTALATGRSTGGTFMPQQIGMVGGPTLPKGIQTQAMIDADSASKDEEAGATGNVWDNIMLGVEEAGPPAFHRRGVDETPPSIDAGNLPTKSSAAKPEDAPAQKTATNNNAAAATKKAPTTTTDANVVGASEIESGDTPANEAMIETGLNRVGEIIDTITDAVPYALETVFERPGEDVDKARAARAANVPTLGTDFYNALPTGMSEQDLVDRIASGVGNIPDIVTQLVRRLNDATGTPTGATSQEVPIMPPGYNQDIPMVDIDPNVVPVGGGNAGATPAADPLAYHRIMNQIPGRVSDPRDPQSAGDIATLGEARNYVGGI